MERPNILNIPDFFIIGLSALLFFFMLDVLGAGIVTFQGWRLGTSSKTNNGGTP